jgi:hypothetical protein
VAWIGYTLAHGAASGWYPYDFLDVSTLGYAVALRNLAFVVLVALVFLLAFWLVDRKLPATWRPWSPHHRRPRRSDPEQAASADRPTGPCAPTPAPVGERCMSAQFRTGELQLSSRER